MQDVNDKQVERSETWRDLEKSARSYKAKTGVGCDGFHVKVPLDLTKRNKRTSVGIIGEGGAVWEMAAANLHDDVLLETEECYE